MWIDNKNYKYYQLWTLREMPDSLTVRFSFLIYCVLLICVVKWNIRCKIPFEFQTASNTSIRITYFNKGPTFCNRRRRVPTKQIHHDYPTYKIYGILCSTSWIKRIRSICVVRIWMSLKGANLIRVDNNKIKICTCIRHHIITTYGVVDI